LNGWIGLILAVSVTAAALGFVGCTPTSQRAPLVADLPAGVDLAAAERGRRLYITDCARCHAVEPVHDYSRARWRELIPEMAELAKHNAQQRRDLEAYIFSALEVPADPGRRQSQR